MLPPTLYSKAEVLAVLNVDFARECCEVLAYAVYTGRLTETATGCAVAGRGEKAVLHSLILGQLIADIDGCLVGGIDEEEAFEQAVDVPDPDWPAATGFHLRVRCEQLRSLAWVGYVERLRWLVQDKE